MKLVQRLKWKHVRGFYEKFSSHLKARPVKMPKPEAGRVLVFSPHVDDEVIGPGGTLHRHVLQGDHVTVIYFADCTEERIAEAKAATAVMGFDEPIFFKEYQGKTLTDHAEEILPRLEKIINKIKPDIIYLPSLLELHNDHLAVNHFLALLYKKNKYQLTVYAFEVWTTFIPNVLIDITDTIDIKKKAIEQNTSQLLSKDWVGAASALNQYRAIVGGHGQFAEGFMVYNLKSYYQMWSNLYG